MKKTIFLLLFVVIALLTVSFFLLLHGNTSTNQNTTNIKDEYDAKEVLEQSMNSNGNELLEVNQKTKQENIEINLEHIEKEVINEYHSTTLEAIEDIELQAELIILRKEAAKRYQELRGKPQVVWGTLSIPTYKDIENPLKMSLGLPAGKKTHRIISDDQMHFAFPEIGPGTYEIIAYETAETPGIRLENIKIGNNQSLNEINLSAGKSTIEVKVKDEKGHGLASIYVSIAKSGGGLNGDLFTYKRGLSDDQGRFIGKNLVDGTYVISAKYEGEILSNTVTLLTDEYKSVEMSIRTSGAQLRGFVRGTDSTGFDGVQIIIAGHETGGEHFYKSTRSEPNGEFSFDLLPKGIYEVSVAATELYSGSSMQVSIEDEYISHSDIVLVLYNNNECGEIKGEIEYTKDLRSGEQLVIKADDDKGIMQAYSLVTDNGLFSLKMLPPGRYHITALLVGQRGKASELADTTTIIDSGKVIEIFMTY